MPTSIVHPPGETHAQFGEDRFAWELLARVGVRDGYFVEFGAWDGKHLSNTYLFYRRGWSGCYIEGDPLRYRDLQRNITRDGVTKVCRYVRTTGEDSLDEILRRAGAPLEIDFLSIDIDGDDLLIWESVKMHVPKCVVIEYNPTIPLGLEVRNPPGAARGAALGNSLSAIEISAQRRGYRLVRQTKFNLIFLREDLAAAADIPRAEPVRMRELFFGYEGALFRHGEGQTLALKMDAPWLTSLVLPVPVWMAGPGTMKNLIRHLYHLWCLAWCRPDLLVGKLPHYFKPLVRKLKPGRRG